MQSGRSWVGPAQRRRTRLPVSNIHENRQTPTVHLRHDNITAENNKNGGDGDYNSNHITTQRGHYLVQSGVRQNNSGQVVVGDL